MRPYIILIKYEKGGKLVGTNGLLLFRGCVSTDKSGNLRKIRCLTLAIKKAPKNRPVYGEKTLPNINALLIGNNSGI